MGNTILIKHGNGVPDGKLFPYELGYRDDSSDGNSLYIGGDYQRNDDGSIKLDDKKNPKLGNAIPITTPIPELKDMAGTLPISKGGTDATDAASARNNLVSIGYNPESAIKENDLPANWKALGVGVAYISDGTLTTINGQPAASGYILNGVYGNLVVQTWFSYGSDTFIFKRTGTVDDNTWGKWTEGFSKNDVIPVGNGGTGHDFSSIPANAIIRNSGDNTQLWYTASANGALYATASNGAVKFGTLPIAQGGTGRTTFEEGKVLIGGSNNTIDLRDITNNSSTSNITASTNLITANTLAYWNGRYGSSTSSRLAYCNKGAFGDGITKNIRIGSIANVNDGGWTSVTFSSALPSTPIVVVTPVTSTAGAISGKVTNVTTKGFSVTIGGTFDGNHTFNYIAIC